MATQFHPRNSSGRSHKRKINMPAQIACSDDEFSNDTSDSEKESAQVPSNGAANQPALYNSQLLQAAPSDQYAATDQFNELYYDFPEFSSLYHPHYTPPQEQQKQQQNNDKNTLPATAVYNVLGDSFQQDKKRPIEEPYFDALQNAMKKRSMMKWNREMDEALLAAIRNNVTKLWKDIAEVSNIEMISGDQCKHRYIVLQQQYAMLKQEGPQAVPDMAWLLEFEDFPIREFDDYDQNIFSSDLHINNLPITVPAVQYDFASKFNDGPAMSKQQQRAPKVKSQNLAKTVSESHNAAPIPWTAEEERLLEEYASEHTVTNADGAKKVDWSGLVGIINRSNFECQRKWCMLRHATMKKGPFSAEEDRIIVQRVREWKAAGKGLGLWVALQEELGRSSNNCNHRWNRFLQHKLREQGEDMSLYI